MAITTFNQAPYFDDFDETKNYMRILFRPGYSVQVRELNQLQTALQSQLDKFGSSIYRKEGARVLPVDENITVARAQYVKVKSSTDNLDGALVDENTYLQTDDDGRYLIIGKTIRGTARGVDTADLGNVRAEIIDVLPATYDDTGVIAEPLTLYVKYLSGGGIKNGLDDGVVFTFAPDEMLVTDDEDEIVFSVESTYDDDDGQTVYPTGYGLRASVPESVYFVKGHFVHAPAESVIIGRYSPVPSVRVVYDVTESIVTPAQDSTLNDNSSGTPNASAPGAHRYAITLTLAYDKYNPRYSTYPNAITIGSVRAGVLESVAIEPLSQVGLGQILATRTYEESGNYYLNPLPIAIQELYRDDSGESIAQGYLDGYSSGDQIAEVFVDQIPLGESPETFGKKHIVVPVGESGSTAYVHGWRMQFSDRVPVVISKARTFAAENNISVNSQVGSYIVIDTETAVGTLPQINAGLINLRDTLDMIIGSCRVMNVEYVSSTRARVYLTAINILTGTDGLPVVDSLSEIASITTAGGFVATVTASIADTNHSSYVFALPTEVTKSISDVQYHYRKSTSSTMFGGLSIVWNLTGNDYFVTDTVTDFVTWNTSQGVITPESVSLSSSSQTATLTYTSALTGPTYVIATVRNSNGVGRTKTRRRGRTYIASPNTVAGEHDALAHVDVIGIVGVYASPSLVTIANETHSLVTDNYTLDNGQRDFWYDVGRVRLRCDHDAPAGQLLVVYDYYEHTGAGDFFGPNSYTGDEYEVAPEYRGLSLRDAIDFRKSRTQLEAGLMISLARKPSIILDVEYYLPRWDKIGLSKNGELIHTMGVPSLTPQAPRDADETMTLFTLKIGAYTFVDKRDVRFISHDHRRYTMRDISKLDRRIANLEEMHDLTSLENEVMSEQFLDDDLNPRYRNGFVTDNCKGHIVGYTRSIDYTCSVDRLEGIVYPQFSQANCRLVLNTVTAETSGYRKTGSFLTLNYYQTALIDQTGATGTLSLSGSHVGVLSLSPSTDEWREITTKPMIAIDDNRYDAFAAIKDTTASDPNLAGYIWNEWDTDWAGITRSEGDDVNIESITRDINNALTGINAPNAVIETYGTFEVQRNAISYMRSRKVYFRATGLKPNTRHWLYFGGVNISSFARVENSFVRFEDQNLSAADQITEYKGYDTHPDGSTKLISNDAGEIIGSFIVPHTDGAKFLTGVQEVILVDTTYGQINISTALANYEARGHHIENATRVLLTSTGSAPSTEPPAIIDPPIPDTSTTDPVMPAEDATEAAQRNVIETPEIVEASARGSWNGTPSNMFIDAQIVQSGFINTLIPRGPYNVHYTPPPTADENLARRLFTPVQDGLPIRQD